MEPSLTWRMIAGGTLGSFPCLTPAYGNTFILAILNAPDEILWLNLGADGIAYYHEQQWVWLPELKHQHLVWFRNRLWTSGIGSFLYVVEDQRWRKVPTPFAKSRYLHTDSQGNLWVAPSEGLWRSADGDQWQQVPLPRSGRPVQYFWIDALDVIWLKFSDDNTLYRWQHDKLLPLPLPKKVDNLDRLRSVVRDPAGRMWVGSEERGLWSYYDGMWQQAPGAQDLTEPGLQGSMIEALCCDRRGRMWVLTPAVHCLVNDVWRALLIRTSPDNQLPVSTLHSMPFKCFHLDHRERLWLGSTYGTIAWIDTTAAFEEVPLPFVGMLEYTPAPIVLTHHTVQWV